MATPLGIAAAAARQAASGYALRALPRASIDIATKTKGAKPLHLSTAAQPAAGFSPWLNIESARWLTIQSARTLWASADTVHMIVIATFGVSEAGIPTIGEMSLMPVTRQWLPVEDAFTKQLVDKLVAEGGSFIKGLRYNLGVKSALACATLTDCEGSAPLLFVVPASIGDNTRHLQVGDPSIPVWLWHPSSEAMPTLPPRHRRHQSVAGVAVEAP
jgi:hypothetical protein